MGFEQGGSEREGILQRLRPRGSKLAATKFSRPAPIKPAETSKPATQRKEM